jgi:hypothetical protein
MADIDWSILTNSMARPLDPVTAQYYGSQQRIAQQQAALQQQKLQADQAAAVRAQAAQQQAAQQWSAGDTRGAQATLLGAGSNDLLGTLNSTDKQDFDQRKDGLQAVAGFANYVMTHISDPTQRAAVIQHNKPLLVAAGAHPNDVDTVAGNPSDDVLGGVAHQYYSTKDQDANVRDNAQTVVNQQNADTQRMGEQRLEQTPVGIATTDNVYLPGGMPAPGTAPSAPASQPSAPISIRNNNPGALRPDGQSTWQGATGTTGGFLTFDTPENGRRAQIINLQNQQRLHGINTLGALVTKYAPASDNNDPAAYAATVARAIGVGVNDPINLGDPAIAGRVADAMARVEAGSSPARPQASAQGIPHAGPQTGSNFVPSPAPGVRGPTLLSAGVPKPDPNAVDPSDPAIEMAAQQYAATGDMPALGQGQGQLRHAILSRAAQISNERHYTPGQIAANKAQVRASTQALAADNKMYDTIQTSEQTAQMVSAILTSPPISPAIPIGSATTRHAIGSEASSPILA